MSRAFFAFCFALSLQLLFAPSSAHAQAGFGGGAGVDLKSLLQGIPASTGAGGASTGGPGQEEQVDQSGAFQVVPRAMRPYTGNEFQRFIQKTLGHDLPLFGQDLFELDGSAPLPSQDGAPAAGGAVGRNSGSQQNPFGPVAATAVSGNYLIGPGDEIVVKIYSSAIDIDQRFTVSREGVIVLPKVGPIELAGVRASDLERRLKLALSKTLADFNVFATVGRLKGIDIYVVGQARNPGKYTISSMSTVISALFATGGPSSFGSFRSIELVRAGRVVGTVDLYRFIAGGDTGQDMRLVQGDAIHIPPAGPQVAFLGAVQRPAVYELLPGSAVTAVQDLLQLAGGLPVTTNPLDIILERADPTRSRPLVASRIALDESGLRQPLRDGDILRFFPIKPAFSNAITLRILDQPPVRVPIIPGTRIKDVIPDREALLTPEFFIRRFGGASGLEPLPGQSNDSSRGEPPFILKNTVESDCLNMGFMPDSSSFKACRSRLLAGQLPSNSPGVAGVPGAGLGGQGGPVNPIASGSLAATALPQNSGDLNGRAQRVEPADITFQEIRARVQADEINWGYAFIERVSVGASAPELIGFSLEQAVLQGNPRSNIELQPGDVVNVLRRQDVQGPSSQVARLVRLQGEVMAPGVYQLRPNETLDELLVRAGGVSDRAYLFGTILRRESVVKSQQENLNRLVRQMEIRLNSEQSTAPIGSQEQIAVQNLIYNRNLELRRQAIDQARKMKPMGRVALEMDPLATALPPIALEDGDDITVPGIPSSVEVVGSVANENALRFRQDRTLRQVVAAAGALPSADVSRAFILRADGSVVLPELEDASWLGSRTVSRWFASDPLQDVVLMPGDTVIVPDKLVTESGYSVFVRGFKEWTQIIYQLGISAAALKTLRD